MVFHSVPVGLHEPIQSISRRAVDSKYSAEDIPIIVLGLNFESHRRTDTYKDRDIACHYAVSPKTLFE